MGSDQSIELRSGGFWSASRRLAAALALLWGILFLSGIDGLIAFHDREPSLPLREHLVLYAVLPAAGLISSSASFAYAKRLPGWLNKSALLTEALLLLLVLFFWTGGV